MRSCILHIICTVALLMVAMPVCGCISGCAPAEKVNLVGNVTIEARKTTTLDVDIDNGIR